MLSGGHSTGDESPRTETVSVVMATFNGAEFLDEQLESLVTQTQLPDELVVVDDASTDGTQEILRSFARRAPFPVQIVEQPYHVGTSPNFEEGIVRSSGDLVAIADQDDRWRPDKIAVMANRMAREPEVRRRPCASSSCSARLCGGARSAGASNEGGSCTSSGAYIDQYRPGGVNGWCGSGNEHCSRKGRSRSALRACSPSHSIERSVMKFVG